MPRPADMGPADLAPDTVPPEYVDQEQATIGTRNWFYNSLSFEAKERFLEVLAAATERGLSNDEAWEEAVRAAERTYDGEPARATREVFKTPGETGDEIAGR